VAILTDLGFSSTRAGNSLDNSKCLGTPGYTAPEIASGKFGLPTDIFAWAITVYELIENHPPWSYANPAQIDQSIEEGRMPKFSVPESELACLIKRSWDRSPDQRPTAAKIVNRFRQGRYRFPGMNDTDTRNFDAFVESTWQDLCRHEDAILGPLGNRRSSFIACTSWDTAITIKHQAKHQGVREAQFLLGVMYHRGLFFDRDDALALHYLKLTGSDDARKIATEIETTNTQYEKGCVQEEQRNWDNACVCYRLGISDKSRECVTQLGNMLVTVGDAESLKNGIRFLILGRKMGDRKAAYLLGRYYRKQAHNYEEAMREFEFARNLGHQGVDRELSKLRRILLEM
jgi:TPR repeat protein